MPQRCLSLKQWTSTYLVRRIGVTFRWVGDQYTGVDSDPHAVVGMCSLLTEFQDAWPFLVHRRVSLVVFCRALLEDTKFVPDRVIVRALAFGACLWPGVHAVRNGYDKRGCVTGGTRPQVYGIRAVVNTLQQ